jgi:branched-chain amino acid transport system permease protein
VIQALFDGVLEGAILSLGAIGLTLIMHILRFANFSHAELLSIGAYMALVFDALFSGLAAWLTVQWGPTTIHAALALAAVAALAVTAASAVAIDRLVFRRLRENAGPLTMVFGSFGVALIVRNVIALVFGLQTQRYDDAIAFAVMVSADPFLLVKPDQIAVLALALAAMVLLHLLLSRTPLGFALKAISENPALAQVNGVDLKRMVAVAWAIGGGLAALAGVGYALTHQMSPVMGRDLVLSLFAAAIVGGLGSPAGAVLGGFTVGLASSLSLLVLPAGYKPAIPFLLILAVLYIRPHGLFGEAR